MPVCGRNASDARRGGLVAVNVASGVAVLGSDDLPQYRHPVPLAAHSIGVSPLQHRRTRALADCGQVCCVLR